MRRLTNRDRYAMHAAVQASEWLVRTHGMLARLMVLHVRAMVEYALRDLDAYNGEAG
jgi:hypothetical protein